MSLKQNFEWFRNIDSFLIQELIGWLGFRNGFGSFAMGFLVNLSLGFLTRTRRCVHRLYSDRSPITFHPINHKNQKNHSSEFRNSRKILH